jgi:signal transduction histidine kinase
MCTSTSSEDILYGLVHDLRQPLGTLESSLFFLDLVLDHESDRVREQMRVMERQVAQAALLLHRASEELRALRAQRTVEGDAGVPESFARTKSATAGVT